jgi:hypothetical protein
MFQLLLITRIRVNARLVKPLFIKANQKIFRFFVGYCIFGSEASKPFEVMKENLNFMNGRKCSELNLF